MFTVLLESKRPRLPVGRSLVLSAVFHVAVVAGAVVATRNPTFTPQPDSFITKALFLPPVDRRASEAGTAERIQYLALGIPRGLLPELTDLPFGRSDAGRADALDPLRGLEIGDAPLDLDATAWMLGKDTAYSVLEVDSTVERYLDSDAPLYPPLLLSQAVEGSVVLRYVVDTLGRADSRSAEVLRSTHPHFTEAVLQALPGMRFRPAMLASRRVRQLVEQEFAFRIQQPEVATAGTPAP